MKTSPGKLLVLVSVVLLMVTIPALNSMAASRAERWERFNDVRQKVRQQVELVMETKPVAVTQTSSRPVLDKIRKWKDRLTSRVQQLSATQRGEAIALTWSPVEQSDGYRVYYESGSRLRLGSSSVDVAQGHASYLFEGVGGKKIYSFRVTALNGRQESLPSRRVTVRFREPGQVVRSDTGF